MICGAPASVLEAVPAAPSAGPLPPVRMVTIGINADPVLVAGVRRDMQAALRAWGLPGLAEAMKLVASELVSNAVRCAPGKGIGIRLRAEEGFVVLEVTDTNTQAPLPRTASSLEESGRGLSLVDELAESWGWRPVKAGKTVWARLAVPQ